MCDRNDSEELLGDGPAVHTFSNVPGIRVLVFDIGGVVLTFLVFFKIALVVFDLLFPELTARSSKRKEKRTGRSDVNLFLRPNERPRERSRVTILTSAATVAAARTAKLLEPPSHHALCFALTFSLGWMPLHLLVCELSSNLHPWTREVVLSASLHALVALLLLVTPWMFATAVLRDARIFPEPPASSPPPRRRSSVGGTGAGSLGLRKLSGSDDDLVGLGIRSQQANAHGPQPPPPLHGGVGGGGPSLRVSPRTSTTGRKVAPGPEKLELDPAAKTKVPRSKGTKHFSAHDLTPHLRAAFRHWTPTSFLFPAAWDSGAATRQTPLYKRPSVAALLLVVPFWLFLAQLSRALPLDTNQDHGALKGLAAGMPLAEPVSGGSIEGGILAAGFGGATSPGADAVSAGARSSVVRRVGWLFRRALWPLRVLWSTATMRHGVLRLSVIGAALAAILSGVGAATLPFDFLARHPLAPTMRSSRPSSEAAANGHPGSRSGPALEPLSREDGDAGDFSAIRQRLEAELRACVERLAARKREKLLLERKQRSNRSADSPCLHHGGGGGDGNATYPKGLGHRLGSPLSGVWGWWGDLRGLGDESGRTGGDVSRKEASEAVTASARVEMICEEVESLEALSCELFLDLTELHRQWEAALKDARHPPWRRVARQAAGLVLAAAAAVRVGLAVTNVVRASALRSSSSVLSPNIPAASAVPAASPSALPIAATAATAAAGLSPPVLKRGEALDLGTKFLRLLGRHLPSAWLPNDWLDEVAPYYTRAVSLVFIGFLMLSSVRSFLMSVARGRAAALTWRHGGGIGSASTLAPLTTSLMGCYLLASLLLLRIQLPCAYRNGTLALVLGAGAEFGFYHDWFDTAFAASALATTALRVASLKGDQSRLESFGGLALGFEPT